MGFDRNATVEESYTPMNHKHRATLHALFSHPVSNNIDPKAVKSVLENLGAEIGHGGHGQIVVKFNGHTLGLHDSHHSLGKDEVSSIRKLLEESGVDPVRDYPL